MEKLMTAPGCGAAMLIVHSSASRHRTHLWIARCLAVTSNVTFTPGKVYDGNRLRVSDSRTDTSGIANFCAQKDAHLPRLNLYPAATPAESARWCITMHNRPAQIHGQRRRVRVPSPPWRSGIAAGQLFAAPTLAERSSSISREVSVHRSAAWKTRTAARAHRLLASPSPTEPAGGAACWRCLAPSAAVSPQTENLLITSATRS